jgi:hypothetical protein
MEALYPQRVNADLIRRLALASIVAQLLWLVIAVVAGLIEPGYSEIRDAVSALGSPWPAACSGC